jgi:hypothetical protein
LVVIASLYLLLAFLFPVTIYLLVLGVIHRRRAPLLVAGTWDFAGVLFAASGFLLIGGPVILTVLNERWRFNFFLGHEHPGDGDESWHVWTAVWSLYFLVVALGSGLLIWLRRNTTSIYNVEPRLLELGLVQVLDALGWKWVRSGMRFYLTGPVGVSERGEAISSVMQAAQRFPSPRGRPVPTDVDVEENGRFLDGVPVVELDPFWLLFHAGLTWHNTSKPVRRQIETELERVLERLPTGENPVGSWLLSLAAFLFCLMIGVLLLLILIHVGARR